MTIKNEIDNLKTQVLRMSEICIQNITDAINFYLGKESHIQEINDDLVDRFERLIEEMCVNILLRERLYASDLKEVTGILKLVSDLERIGDHALDIYEFSLKLEPYKDLKLDEIEGLSLFVVKMIENSIKAYVNKDYELAEKVIKDDDYVDEKYAEIIDKLSKNEYSIDGKCLPFAIYTTLVVKYLERIADHSVNISEWVVYISNGFYKDKKIF